MKRDEKIDSIMNSLEGVHRASPGYFFYGRLLERLNDTKSFAEGIIRFISRPAVAVAAVLIIILINAYAIFNTTIKPNPSQPSEIASVDEYSQISTPSFSDVEKINP